MRYEGRTYGYDIMGWRAQPWCAFVPERNKPLPYIAGARYPFRRGGVHPHPNGA